MFYKDLRSKKVYNVKDLIKFTYGSVIPGCRFMSFAGIVPCQRFPSCNSLAISPLSKEREGNWTVLSKLKALPLEASFLF